MLSLQEPSHQVGLCGYEVTSGTNLFHILRIIILKITSKKYFKFSDDSNRIPSHRYWAVCFMPTMCLCGYASLSSAASVCSCLIWSPRSSVSLTQSCQVRSVCEPTYSIFHARRWEMLYCFNSFIVMYFLSLFAGVLVLFLGFFAFLHCWLNAFAEMLRFADRMFYKVMYFCCHSQSYTTKFKCVLF